MKKDTIKIYYNEKVGEEKMGTTNVEYLWKARKRNALGLPWTFTEYTLKEDTLIISTGVLNKRYDEIRLYRIRDFTVNRSFGQRLMGLGTIHVCSSDSSTPEFDIKNIKDVMKVKDLISNQVEESRKKAGVSTSEFIGRNNNMPHPEEPRK